MKAAVHVRYGPPTVVRVTDLPTPTPTASEILVKVHATTVNRTDCAYRSGKPFFARAVYGFPRPKATVLGNEFAGRVEAVGGRVTLFNPGDRVFGYNEGPFGGHAEYMVIAETASVATVPAGMSYEQIAPVPKAPTTRSPSSARRKWGRDIECSSTAQPEPSARRPCSC